MMFFVSLLLLVLHVPKSFQYSEQEMRSLLIYECQQDGSVVVQGVPSDYTLTVLNSYCNAYLTAPGEYTIQGNCKNYNYWGYLHGYWSTETTPYWYSSTRYPYRSSRWYYSTTSPWYYFTTIRYRTTTRDYYSTTSDYYGEIDIAISHGSHSGIIGGKEHYEYRLICDGIHSGGKLFHVSNTIGVYTRNPGPLPTLSYRHSKRLRSGYYMSPSLTLTDSAGRTKYQAHLGELIYLTLATNDPRYDIRPETCNAQDLYRSHKLELFDIHHSGCITEPYVMEMFTTVAHGQYSLRAPVYAFRFPQGYSEVVFFCDVRICSKASGSCSLDTCKSTRKVKRESAHDDDGDYDQLSVKLEVVHNLDMSSGAVDHGLNIQTICVAFLIMASFM